MDNTWNDDGQDQIGEEIHALYTIDRLSLAIENSRNGSCWQLRVIRYDLSSLILASPLSHYESRSRPVSKPEQRYQIYQTTLQRVGMKPLWKSILHHLVGDSFGCWQVNIIVLDTW